MQPEAASPMLLSLSAAPPFLPSCPCWLLECGAFPANEGELPSHFFSLFIRSEATANHSHSLAAAEKWVRPSWQTPQFTASSHGVQWWQMTARHASEDKLALRTPTLTFQSGLKYHQQILNGFRKRWKNYHKFVNAGSSWACSCCSFSALFSRGVWWRKIGIRCQMLTGPVLKAPIPEYFLIKVNR